MTGFVVWLLRIEILIKSKFLVFVQSYNEILSLSLHHILYVFLGDRIWCVLVKLIAHSFEVLLWQISFHGAILTLCPFIPVKVNLTVCSTILLRLH